nr:helix-turn-helix domain-containing protein [Pseudooceanicola nitratireducens]
MLRRTRTRLRAIAASRAFAHASFPWKRENVLVPRPAKNLKLEQRIEVAKRFAAGESAKDLAAAFGISPRHVNRLAKEEAGEGIAVRDPSETVAFRASRSELDAFDAEWRERGFANRSQALNAVLRGRCGFLDIPRDLVSEFCAAWRQAKDMSDAGLVLAKAVHRGRLEVSEADRAVLIELLDLAQSMSREMGQMKDAAQALRHQEWPQKEEGQEAENEILEDDPRAIERGLRLVRNG